jgi:DNA-binding transcriptional LysR family regulator
MQTASLDIDAVRAFTLVADLKNFTRAAQALGVTQSAVSLQLKRLEARLDRQLVSRTPRMVQLTADGAAFLDSARTLIDAHDHALNGEGKVERRLKLGIGDHVAGPNLPALLSQVSAADPQLRLEVRIDFSSRLIEAADAGRYDAVIVRREPHQRGGELLFEDTLGWYATPAFHHAAGSKLRLAMLTAPCGVRAHAIRVLDKARIAWTEAFTGGGVTAVAAAALAGIAVAPMADRVAPPGTIDVGAAFGLPPLGRSRVVMYGRASNPTAHAALRTLAAAFRGRAKA